MASHTALICWSRGGARFIDKKYSRAHTWSFDGGLSVPASSSPHVVPLPHSEPANIDPEEAYVAALSSCHMLEFLWLAARRGFTVDEYRDQATGLMEKNAAGKLAITEVMLRPHVVFSGHPSPSSQDVDELHHEAHENCYLANSVKSRVVTLGAWSLASPPEGSHLSA